MVTYTTEVDVEVDLDDFDNEELIEELESRGFQVSEYEPDIVAIENDWNRGAKKDALILLERMFPELRGISKLVD